MRTVGTAGSRPDLPLIVSTFLKSLGLDSDPRIRATLATEVGKIASEIVRYRIAAVGEVPGLVEEGLIAALSDESHTVNKAAARALRGIGTPSALAAAPTKSWWQLG
jgi:hypothetical protein